MTDQTSESRLRALIAQWRESAVWESEHSNHHRASDLDQCADELEAALAEDVPPAEPGVPGSEVLCEECAKVFCPHGERLHFHHDGCPACSFDEPEPATRAA